GDFAWGGVDELRYRLARHLDSRPHLSPWPVQGAGVAVVLAQIGQHGFQHSGVEGSGGGVIEISVHKRRQLYFIFRDEIVRVRVAQAAHREARLGQMA
nr:hypothetical protein [Tanacetum cinerariifolium]